MEQFDTAADLDETSAPSFWLQLFFSTVALIVIVLLYCCVDKRKPDQAKNGQEKFKNTYEETVTNGNVGVTNGVNGEVKPSWPPHLAASHSSTSSEAEEEALCQSRSARTTHTSPIGDHSSDSGTNSDEMEIIGSRHLTTIEIKHFKTAVLPSKNKKVKRHGGNQVTSAWNGTMFHDQANGHLSNGTLEYEKSNLLEHEDAQNYSSTATQDVADFAIVQVTVGQHTLESYGVEQKPADDLYVDEHGDRVEEIVTWRKREELKEGSQHRNSIEKRSSVLEVIGAKDVGEVLEKVESLETVTEIIRLAGLEQSQLIFGIDYTASNQHQGKISFDGDSLHSIRKGRQNPYQQVISIMGKTLAPLARGGYIPAYGFGDIRTSDTSIFPLKSDGHCVSFDEVLEVYNKITPKIILAGPTNFAPLIYQAIEICKEFKRYYILVIVADGQVTNEPDTRNAIVEACSYPLSIILVGVGDGPWDMMRIFDEKLPKRSWDNFHFVEFYKVTHGAKHPELAFAVQALLEIPDQYQQIKALGLLD